MAAIVVVHSFMRETGKTFLAASLALLLAREDKRVGVVEADIAVPSLHNRFRLDTSGFGPTLNDYLLGNCTMLDTVVDLTWRHTNTPSGALLFVPASTNPADISDVLRQNIDVTILDVGLRGLVAQHELDVVIVNAPTGLDEISLSCIALADILVIVLRLDKEDYHGTSVTIDLARDLKVPELLLAVTRVPAEYDQSEVRRRVETTYQCDAPVVLSVVDETEMLFTGQYSVLEKPLHPLATLLKRIRSRVA